MGLLELPDAGHFALLDLRLLTGDLSVFDDFQNLGLEFRYSRFAGFDLQLEGVVFLVCRDLGEALFLLLEQLLGDFQLQFEVTLLTLQLRDAVRELCQHVFRFFDLTLALGNLGWIFTLGLLQNFQLSVHVLGPQELQ